MEPSENDNNELGNNYQISEKMKKMFKKNQQIEQKLKKQVVIGRDDRVIIQNTHEYPYSNIGYLQCSIYTNHRKWDHFGGTATLIQKDLLVTAAHNVYIKTVDNIVYNQEVNEIIFYPAISRSIHTNQKIKVKKAFIYPQLYRYSKQKSEEQRKNDYAFLVLEQPYENFKDLPILTDYPQTQYKIGIYGYPGDKSWRDNVYMYGIYGDYTLINNDFLTYTIDTQRGQSGSAIIVFQSAGYIGIIGIHTSGDNSIFPTHNNGLRLTSQKIKSLNQIMIKQHKRQIHFIPLS